MLISPASRRNHDRLFFWRNQKMKILVRMPLFHRFHRRKIVYGWKLSNGRRGEGDVAMKVSSILHGDEIGRREKFPMSQEVYLRYQNTQKPNKTCKSIHARVYTQKALTTATLFDSDVLGYRKKSVVKVASNKSFETCESSKSLSKFHLWNASPLYHGKCLEVFFIFHLVKSWIFRVRFQTEGNWG
jgi:hypothetical protein